MTVVTSVPYYNPPRALQRRLGRRAFGGFRGFRDDIGFRVLMPLKPSARSSRARISCSNEVKLVSIFAAGAGRALVRAAITWVLGLAHCAGARRTIRLRHTRLCGRRPDSMGLCAIAHSSS